MASASVVGQHRLDSELPLFVFKLTSARRKASRDKMMFSEAVTPEGEPPGAQALSPGPVGKTAARGGMTSAEGAAYPRSRDRDGEEDEESADCDRQTGHVNITTGDRNSNRDCDLNQNTSGCWRQSSLKRSGFSVAQDAQRHRESRQNSGSASLSAGRHSGSLPLERLTQAKSGVVRLARQEPFRREAWSIFPQGHGLDPRVRTENGEGHQFEAKPVTQDWCDACSRKITAQALKCQNCSYTCHLECQRQVQLDCNQRDRQPEKPPSATSSRSASSSSATARLKNEAKEEEEGGTKDLSAEEVQTKIEEYNAQVSETGMKLASDGSYTGFVKVHLRLSRPVTVSSVEAIQRDLEGAARQKGSQDQAPLGDQEGTECGQSEKKTSFYLPCDCVKHLHISSLNTTRDVIQNLLKKFMVLDNPRKFALYGLTHRDGQDLFQKLPLCERPLLLRLIAGPDPEQLTFVLKENETGEVEWHAFSVPELQNFLVILEKEETERVRAVEQKYGTYRQKLQQALQQHDP
uniref:ras association domain-containing protein 5 isoform X2 n=1 Tax=Solea senegalensis TaxID=28829 RepID=UPI001CD8A945|nr:ras association domain-containing protein 5 isoform X2 [Solea senegalensis]